MAGINRTTGKATDLITFSRASRGTALRKISYGSELVTNGDFGTGDLTGWSIGGTDGTHYVEYSSGGARYVSDTTSPILSLSQTGILTIGKIYEISITTTAYTSGSLKTDSFSGTSVVSNGLGTITVVGVASSTSFVIVRNSANVDVTIDNISVKEVLFDQPDGTLTLFNHPTNIPRIEYAADGTVKGLLIEEARTNSIVWSEAWGVPTSPWTQFAFGGTTTPTTLANGISGFTVSASANREYYQVVTSSLPAGEYTLSVYGENFIGTLSRPVCYASVTSQIYSSDFVNGRASKTFTHAGGTLSVRIGVGTDTADSGTVTLGGIQLEAGSFPTSYIPTSGATATRAADIASISVDSFGYRQDAGTVVVEAQLLYNPNSIQVPVFLGDNPSATTNNSQLFFGDGTYRVRDSSGTTLAEIDAGSFSASSFVKAVFTYNLNDFAASINGGAVVSDTSGDPSNVSSATLSLSANPVGTILGHHIKSVSYYPRRLSNAQLVQLTA